MAIKKETKVCRIEVVGNWNVRVATDTIIKENGTEISRSRHRHVLMPYVSYENNGTWIHTDTDISTEDALVQAICGIVWTDTAKNLYKAMVNSMP